MPKFIDLTGERFGRLVVIKRAVNNQNRRVMWLCLCDCGAEKIIRGGHLKSGHTKSCVCLSREINKNNQHNFKHGHSKNKKVSKIYKTWQHMIERCTNPKSKDYPSYGGRGITVCKRWRNLFENFLEDMGEPSTKNQSIDRINNHGNYCKSNCRWSTRKEQARNTRRNHLETYKGKTQCLAALSEEYQIPYATLLARINTLGWSIEKALTTPVGKQGRKRRKKIAS